MDDRDTDSEWETFAQKDPYWAVLSSDDFRSENIDDEALVRFFRSGENYIDHVFDAISKQLGRSFQPARALDFGCGVGRLAIPLAARSAHVVGVDISETMLQLGRHHAEELNLANVEFIRGDDTLSLVEGPFDFINSYIVLQHIPRVRGERLFVRLLDLLAPGGTAALHVTFAKEVRHLQHEQQALAYYRREGSMFTGLNLTTGPMAPYIQMNDYDLHALLAMVHARGLVMHGLELTSHDGHLGAMIYCSRTVRRSPL